VRAVWACWQQGRPLDFKGERYQLNLMVPLFNPGPIAHPAIPIHLAAVNRYMCQVAGEVADGIRPHPVCTPDYIARVMLPELAKGAARAGRDPACVAVCIKPLIATAADEAGLRRKLVDVRARVAFYASTPAYRACFEHHGLGDLADKMEGLSRAQRWEEMPPHISDEVLNLYATVGTYAEIGAKLAARYGQLVDAAEFSIPVGDEAERQRLAGLLRDLQSLPPPVRLRAA